MSGPLARTTGVAVPEAALEHHIAILAKTGAGKSYAAQGIAEYLLAHGERVCVIDPTGRWWGLRSNAAGDGPGYPVIVFGGRHADVPLEAHHGNELSEIVGTTNTPAIFDTRAMTVSGRTRFFTDFAETLIRRNEGPLTVIVDEAHLFMPQGGAKVGGGAPAMLHAGNNLVSLGRGVGLRIILISQRPAKLHKDALTQVETLIALRLIAPQDRNAIKDWIVEWADPAEGKELIEGLPALPTGTGWIWAPELGVLKKVAFPPIRTYDGGKPQQKAAPVLASIDVPEIMSRLGRIAEEAKANDPKALKAEIARLKREAGGDPKAVEQARQEGYERGLEQGAQQQAAKDNEILAEMRRAIDAATGYLVPFIKADDGGVPVVKVRRPAPPPVIEHRPAPKREVTTDGGALPKGEKTILCALAQYPGGCTREQLSVLTGYKRSSRDTYVQRLREKGYAEPAGAGVVATDAGIEALGPDYQPLPTGPELQRYWLDRLPEGERRILQVLIEAYPAAVDRSALDDLTGYKRSSRDTYIQRLRARQLVKVTPAGVMASDELA